jgi:hypothetical protein
MPQLNFPPGAAGDHRADSRLSPASLLGVAHPLVRTIETLAVVASQSFTVATLLVAGVIAARSGAAWGMPVAASAAFVLLFLAIAAGLLLQQRRGEVVALIAGGEGRMPLGVVQRERERLLSRRTRTALAESLDALVDEAANPPAIPARPLFDPVVVARAAPELRQVAVLLRGDVDDDARAVALVWRLICDGATSPLYCGEADELRAELVRIRFVFQTKRS